jgi:hypothetical protein
VGEAHLPGARVPGATHQAGVGDRPSLPLAETT